MQLIKNASLDTYTTFRIEAVCDQLYRIDDPGELQLAAQYLEKPLILGGGSNILPVGVIHRNVVRVELKGIERIEEKADTLVRVAAGEVWHEFVQWAIAEDLGGIENLSLIPGTVGAAPIQNIGAYGVELDSVVHSVEALELGTGKTVILDKADCGFGYRDSIFKNEYRGLFIITAVTFRLTREHTINTQYGAIRDVLSEWGIHQPNIADVSKAVIHIRQSKLPEPSIAGNAGSFFKNPVVTTEHFESLKSRYPEVPGFPSGENEIKVPAGWLIEQAGWKGKRRGKVGCYDKQALVLVNFGGATGDEVLAFAREIVESVENQFSVRLDPEVNIWT